jgi:hypothetical protein
MKVDTADLHRDTKTGLSEVSEDHPGTLGVAKSGKRNVYGHQRRVELKTKAGQTKKADKPMAREDNRP